MDVKLYKANADFLKATAYLDCTKRMQVNNNKQRVSAVDQISAKRISNNAAFAYIVVILTAAFKKLQSVINPQVQLLVLVFFKCCYMNYRVGRKMSGVAISAECPNIMPVVQPSARHLI